MNISGGSELIKAQNMRKHRDHDLPPAGSSSVWQGVDESCKDQPKTNEQPKRGTSAIEKLRTMDWNLIDDDSDSSEKMELQNKNDAR